MRWVTALLVVAAAGCGNRSPSYDRKTPESTVRSFFAALERGRIPADLAAFIDDEQELAAWRLRCKTRGCTGGVVQIADVEEEAGGERAVVKVEYAVYGNAGQRVMTGKESEIVVVRDGDGERWRIEQFGRRTVIRPGKRGPNGEPGTGNREPGIGEGSGNGGGGGDGSAGAE